MALGNAESLAVILVMLGNIAVWVKGSYEAKKKPSNGNCRACQYHNAVESRMSTIETHKAELAKELGVLHTENRADHQRLFDDIKGLSIDMAKAAQFATTAASAAAAAAAAVSSVASTQRRK